ncbi:MAG: outer membrane lipoprotein chaperone LolA [Pseudomonadales bacterium]
MKKILSFMFCGLLLLAANIAQADLSASKALADRLAGMQSFRADFLQTVLDGQGNNLQTTRGEMAVQRPGHFYWRAEPPLEQLVVSDGEQLWSYDPDLEQVTVQAMDQRLTQTPALLLSGEVKDLADSYEVTQFEISDQVQQFHLRPKNPDSLFENLRLTFSGETLVQMHFLDSLGQRSSLEFENVKINPTLDEALFRFTPPHGVDVIHQ